MIIRLNEIPAEGRDYQYDRKSGELNELLADLIDDADYDVSLTIRPIGNAFEVRGSISTTIPEICSHCGYDFPLKLHRRVNEVLFEDLDEGVKGHQAQGNHSVDFLSDGPGMTPYLNDTFELGEFVHEEIAIDEPLYPTCGPNGTCEHAEEVESIKAKLEAEWAAAEAKAEVNPAFSVLAGLQLPDADA